MWQAVTGGVYSGTECDRGFLSYNFIRVTIMQMNGRSLSLYVAF